MAEPFASWQKEADHGQRRPGSCGATVLRVPGEGYRALVPAFSGGQRSALLSSNFRSDGDPDTESTVRSTLSSPRSIAKTKCLLNGRSGRTHPGVEAAPVCGTFSLNGPSCRAYEWRGGGGQLNLDAAGRPPCSAFPEEIPPAGRPISIGERVVLSARRVDQQCSKEGTQTIGRTVME
jgi:hypothetical protein